MVTPAVRTVLSASSEPEVKIVAAWVVPENVKGRRASATVAMGDFMEGIWRLEIGRLGSRKDAKAQRKRGE